MKKALIVATSLFFFLLLGSATDTPKAMASPKPVTWDKLVEAAKKEGKVMVYGRTGPEERKELRKSFTGKFGIDLEFLYIPQGEALASKIKKERSVGQYVPDVIIHESSTSINLLKPEGILDPMEPLLILPEVADPNLWRKGLFFIDEDCMVKPMLAIFLRYAIRNTALVKDRELTSYRDLLDHKWKGKILMGDPTVPGSSSSFLSFLSGIWGRSQTMEFMRHLVKQEPFITKERRSPMEWVARGQYPIGIGLRMDVFPEFLKLGLPVAAIKMDEGGKMGPGSGAIAIVNKRPHPNASALFLNWVLTKEGQTVWSKANGFASARLDISTEWVHPSSLPMPGEKFWVEKEEIIKARSELLQLNKDIFGPLLK